MPSPLKSLPLNMSVEASSGTLPTGLGAFPLNDIRMKVITSLSSFCLRNAWYIKDVKDVFESPIRGATSGYPLVCT